MSKFKFYCELFTPESIRIYKRHFTNVTFIVFTHTGADGTHVQQQKDEGAIVQLLERPVERSLGNVDLRAFTTLTGLKIFKDHGAKYVYKTRCDLQMYAVYTN